MKKSIIHTLIALLILLYPLSHSFAQLAITSFGLSDQALALIKAENKATSSGKSTKDITLMPTDALLTAQLLSTLESIKVKSVVETIHLLPNARGAQSLALYRALLNITSLKGLEFFSRSEESIKELIYDIYFVDSFENKNRIANPAPSSLAPVWQGVMMQDDETFGAKYYNVSIYTAGNEILMITQNLERLTQGPITTAKPKEMIMAFHLIPSNDGLILYQLIATAQGIPGFVRNKAEASLFNRQEAYKNWIAAIYPR